MSAVIISYHNMSAVVISYHNMSADVISYHNMSVVVVPECPEAGGDEVVQLFLLCLIRLVNRYSHEILNCSKREWD
jgi:hypothetical protein